MLIQSFISAYYIDRIDFVDREKNLKEICTTRSGLQFFVDDFGSIGSLKEVLTELKESGDIEDFDSALKRYIEEFPRDWKRNDYKDFPSSHWWWL